MMLKHILLAGLLLNFPLALMFPHLTLSRGLYIVNLSLHLDLHGHILEIPHIVLSLHITMQILDLMN
jgi:hypothetical protein